MPDTADCTRRHCYFSGRVQGVGFRYCTRNIAIGYDVTGFVRNLPDGRVELVAEGPVPQVDSFIEAVSDRMKPYIREAEQREESPCGHFPHFMIGR